MEKKQLYKLIIILGVILGTIGILTLFIIFYSEINETLVNVEGAWTVLIIVLIRMGICSFMSFYMFWQWFKQEEQYLSDIPFLFGLFFLLFVYGKALDLVVNFTYYTLDTNTFLLILKLRHFVLILTLIPMIYLSIGIILIIRSLKKNREKLRDEKYRNKLRFKIIVIIFIIESIIIALIPNATFAGIIVPIIAFPSLIVIIWMFYFAYRNQRLPQTHPLIISIGFGLYLITQTIRPLVQIIIGLTATFLIIVEIIDLLVFVIIFIGVLKKVKYKE